MDILEQIIKDKRLELKRTKLKTPESILEDSKYFTRDCISMKASILDSEVGIIAEIKRASPSAGNINSVQDVADTMISYVMGGAAGLSVLTEGKYFKGKSTDISDFRHLHTCPILRKDFIIDEYQIIEAKSIGADCILLIAAALQPEDLKRLARFAKSLGLEVLMEVKDLDEIDPYLNDDLDLVGVNNRDLRNFKIDIQKSIDFYESIPDDFVKISESGIDSPDKIKTLLEVGYKGFLIGSYFMKQEDPGEALKTMIESSQKLIQCF